MTQSDALRIAFVSLHTSPAARPGSGDAGGMNVVELAQAEALAALGHRVDLITRRNDAEVPAVVELSPGVTLRHLDVGPPRFVAKSEQEAFIEPFGSALAELEPYDIVHSHHWFSGVAALPVARAWGVPHVQSFHSVAALPGSELSEGEPPESPGRVAGERLAAQQSDLVVAVSEAERRTVIERCGADPERVVVVHPGVDAELFRPLTAGEERWVPPGRPADQPYLLFAARLQPLKGADVAVEALGRVPADVRPHLVVAGETSPDFAGYADELHALVHTHGLDDHVTFLGSQERPELARMLRSAALLVMPSHSETFGLIALEAEASGTPVIATWAGGLAEAVHNGETGVLLDWHHPDEWGAVITELMADPEHRSAMGRAARAFALGFSWDAVAQALIGHYRGLRA